MPAHELLDQPVDHVFDVEPAAFGSDLGMKHDVEQDVAELLPHVGVVFLPDGADKLLNLFIEMTED